MGSICRRCGTPLTPENQQPGSIRRGRCICRTCDNSQARIWVAAHRERVKEQQRRSHAKAKSDVVAAYGGQCACCGENIPEFLEMDHIYNDGAQHRRELRGKGGVSTYRHLRKLGYPKDRYQLLCANCNHAKGYYGRCPHVRVDLVAMIREGRKF